MALEWLAPVIEGVGDLTGNLLNYFSTKKTNEANKQIHQADNDFQAHQTQLAWERDDTAHQREVADLEAAGLSPLANTTGSQVTSPLGSASPIAQQAPQFSFNGIANSLLQAKQLQETERHNKVQEGYEGLEYVNQCKELEQKARELEIENKKVNETINYNSKYLKNLSDQISETKRHNEKEEELKKLSWESENYFKEIDKQTGGNCNYKDYYDLAEYEAAMTEWTSKYDKLIDKLKETSKSSASNEQKAGSATVQAGVPLIVNGELSGSGSHSTGESSSENISQKQQAIMDKFYKTNPMPVFHYYKAAK